MPEKRINICRPGYNASCALCCGSHNYDAEPLEIERLFSKRRKAFSYYSREYLIKKTTSSRSSLTGSYCHSDPFTLTLPALHEESLQCPYVAFVNDNITAGCCLYPEGGHGGQSLDCINAYRSRRFICRAMETLTDDEIIYAARITGDWFYYSILIHHHEYIKELTARYPEHGDINLEVMKGISEELKKRRRENRQLHSIHTYF